MVYSMYEKTDEVVFILLFFLEKKYFKVLYHSELITYNDRFYHLEQKRSDHFFQSGNLCKFAVSIH